MLLSDFTITVVHRCKGLGIPPPSPDVVETVLPSALHALTTECMDDDRCIYVESRSFSAALTSGVADFSSSTSMLMEGMTSATHSDGTRISILPNGTSESALDQERSSFYYWGVRVAKKLLVVDGDAEAPDDGTVTATAPAVPTLGGIDSRLEDDLVAKWIEVYQSKVAAAA